MLDTAISAITATAGSMPQIGTSTLASASHVVSVAPPANPSALDAVAFHQDVASSRHVIGVGDAQAGGLAFHPDHMPVGGAGQDIADRISSLSQQLQSRPLSASQGPSAGHHAAGAANATGGTEGAPHDGMSAQMTSVVGELRETYFYMMTTSFFSHVGSQCMQVFNTLLKGQ